MRYRELGNTGMKVSELGFGAWAIGGDRHGNSYGKTDDKTSGEALHKAIDLGVNFFDTADVYGYGHSEELLGKALRSQRDRVIIATKVGGDFYSGVGRQNFSGEYIRFAIEHSLKRLNTDYIDIYQLHNPPLKLIERSETYATLKELKREGKIRAWGVSIFDPVEGLAALKVGHPDCLQVVYNIFSQKPADELFGKAVRAGCAIIAREPLANGFLTGKYTQSSEFPAGDMRHAWPRPYISARAKAAEKLSAIARSNGQTPAQLALRFILACGSVSVTIPGVKTAAQAEENFAASDLGALPAGDLARVQALAARNFEI